MRDLQLRRLIPLLTAASTLVSVSCTPEPYGGPSDEGNDDAEGDDTRDDEAKWESTADESQPDDNNGQVDGGLNREALIGRLAEAACLSPSQCESSSAGSDDRVDDCLYNYTAEYDLLSLHQIEYYSEDCVEMYFEFAICRFRFDTCPSESEDGSACDELSDLLDEHCAYR